LSVGLEAHPTPVKEIRLEEISPDCCYKMIGVARGGKFPQISSISYRFVLWKAASYTKCTVACLQSKFFSLATLLLQIHGQRVTSSTRSDEKLWRHTRNIDCSIYFWRM